DSWARRHRVVAVLTVMAVVLVAMRGFGNEVIYNWTGPWFDRLIVRMADPPPDWAPDGVSVIGVPRYARMESLAQEKGVPGVSQSNHFSFRRLHGLLMQNLARSGALVVVWDVFFGESSSFDADFVRGVLALKDAPISVVVAVRKWWLGE